MTSSLFSMAAFRSAWAAALKRDSIIWCVFCHTRSANVKVIPAFIAKALKEFPPSCGNRNPPVRSWETQLGTHQKRTPADISRRKSQCFVHRDVACPNRLIPPFGTKRLRKRLTRTNAGILNRMVAVHMPVPLLFSVLRPKPPWTAKAVSI